MKKFEEKLTGLWTSAYCQLHSWENLNLHHTGRRLKNATAEVVDGQGGRRELLCQEDGMSTAEYAIGTLAAAAIAGVLLAIAKSAPFKAMLTKMINSAFTV
ncbi:hypothetical protein BK816_00635 [Boudabousia tangfeifanii]|uniref:DUF4244 domain-containing protein n=1 Tax=Boudabousia tangfeifanii TaxID=1912795 RepID=A0A1D9MI56_9ACTO|nr:DUF4244 domain-containing protein [Boudabousia tangfeifanii]AOZ71982.1 hypothetical protein BK816_00635 [Boudabousia tangfeifanii]